MISRQVATRVTGKRRDIAPKQDAKDPLGGNGHERNDRKLIVLVSTFAPRP